MKPPLARSSQRDCHACGVSTEPDSERARGDLTARCSRRRSREATGQRAVELGNAPVKLR